MQKSSTVIELFATVHDKTLLYILLAVSAKYLRRAVSKVCFLKHQEAVGPFRPGCFSALPENM